MARTRQKSLHAVRALPHSRIVLTVLFAWLTMLAFDFFLHAGLLAQLYLIPSPFLLSRLDAFERIPFGYLSFLIAACLLVWLMVRQRVRGWRAGFGFGLKLGAMIWAVAVLGLYSISTASALLLLAWFVGQAVEYALAGAVAGGALAGARLGGLTVKVLVLLLLSAIVTVGLQSLGLVPTAGLPRQ